MPKNTRIAKAYPNPASKKYKSQKANFAYFCKALLYFGLGQNRLPQISSDEKNTLECNEVNYQMLCGYKAKNSTKSKKE